MDVPSREFALAGSLEELRSSAISSARIEIVIFH
jgi:hypothetical protein